MRVINLFPTPLWVDKLDPGDAERVNRAALDTIESIRAETPGIGPNDRWQTPTNLQDRPELGELMGFINGSVTEALRGLRIDYQSFLVTGCWANIKPQGAGHIPHLHSNNFLSGVYYVRAPEEGGRIVFYDPRVQPFINSPHVTEENEYNCPTANVAVQEGMLVIFPSWLTHSVENNASRDVRISIAFNIMFSQFGETMGQPKWGSAM